jgi:hypothetical protein
MSEEQPAYTNLKEQTDEFLERLPIPERDAADFLKERIKGQEEAITNLTGHLSGAKAKLKSLKAALKALEPKVKK